MTTVDLPLLPLGRGADPASERGVECPGDLPAASDPDLVARARAAAARPDAEYIVFCGVHFMAESADILTSPEQKVVLPDLAAGCSMADMARLSQVEDAWDVLADAGVADGTIPVTYMNSSADIKAFCGRHGGGGWASSNANSVLGWVYAPGEKELFLPHPHLGRQT